LNSFSTRFIPEGERKGPMKLLVTNIDYNDYVGRLAIGRIFSGLTTKKGTDLHDRRQGRVEKARVTFLYGF